MALPPRRPSASPAHTAGWALAALVVGAALGWAMGSRRGDAGPEASAPFPPSDRELQLSKDLEKTRAELTEVHLALEAARSIPKTAEEPEEFPARHDLTPTAPSAVSTPPPPPSASSDIRPHPAQAAQPPDPALKEWMDRVQSATDIGDLLNLDFPISNPKDPRFGPTYLSFVERMRQLLKQPKVQEALIQSLPSLNNQQLTRLNGMLFMGGYRIEGLQAFGQGFAVKMSRELADVLFTRPPDVGTRRILTDMILADPRHLPDGQLEALRQALASDPDPQERRKAAQMPRRW